MQGDWRVWSLSVRSAGQLEGWLGLAHVGIMEAGEVSWKKGL